MYANHGYVKVRRLLLLRRVISRVFQRGYEEWRCARIIDRGSTNDEKFKD